MFINLSNRTRNPIISMICHQRPTALVKLILQKKTLALTCSSNP
jgi:hypothetical protein